MSEFETYMVIAECLNLALMSLGIYMTVMSGFLVTVYSIGQKLGTGQAWYLCIVFLIFIFFAIWGSISYFAAAELFLPQLKSLPPGIGLINIFRPSLMVGVLEIAGIFGALMFFRNIRNG